MTSPKLPPGKPFERALREVVRAIDDRLAMLPDHAQAVRLMTASFILTNRRVPQKSLAQFYKGVKIMHKFVAYDEMLLTDRMAILRSLGGKKLKQPDRKTEKMLVAAIRIPNS